jgi:hypothetical protein
MVSGDSTAKNGFPDHTQLPESDSTPVLAKRTVGQNWQEHFQGTLLTDLPHPKLSHNEKWSFGDLRSAIAT